MRARGDDRRTLPDFLSNETHRPLAGRHGREGGFIRHRGAIGVAVEFDIAAKREGRNPPVRSVAVVKAEKFRSEP